MFTEKDVTKRFQQTLKNFTFQAPDTFGERFAQNRFLKKFEEPDKSVVATLSDRAWGDFIEFDGTIGSFRRLPSVWYKVRVMLHECLTTVPIFSVRLPKGSEFTPTLGNNSIEARLAQSDWTCTRDNFDRFAEIVYKHKALKRAARRRYGRWFTSSKFNESHRVANSILFSHFKEHGDQCGYLVFKWKLSQIMTWTYGSRFGTVPKNNEKRRPINVEPFANLVCQAELGDYFRYVLKEHFGQDLNNLQIEHRKRIRDLSLATIDLSNASDSVSLRLCEFLLPKHVFKKVIACRSEFILGPDKNYHPLKKVSSMGNGFTFELMSLILTCLCRVYDNESSVYGDDIIIKREYVDDLIQALTGADFVVNVDKSFWAGPFRESCGANYHEAEGYIESFDFLWPNDIGDCVLIWNKVRILGKTYPSFKLLENALYRSIPEALRCGPDLTTRTVIREAAGNPQGDIREMVQYDIYIGFETDSLPPGKRPLGLIEKRISDLQLEPSQFVSGFGFKWVPDLRTKTLKKLSNRDWAKYEMYLAAGRCAKDVITGEGRWVRVNLQISRIGNLKTAILLREQNLL